MTAAEFMANVAFILKSSTSKLSHETEADHIDRFLFDFDFSILHKGITA